MPFELSPLPYAFNALEPHIDARTMEIHHGKHHQAYVTNLNNAISGTDAEGLSLEEICRNISKYPMAVRNNGGGHYNHDLFWSILSPSGGGMPSGSLMDAISSTFGTFDDFKSKFAAAGTTRFGSGWAWLLVTPEKKLVVSSTPNQDNPLMSFADKRGIPVLGIDVWEHAYYLNYQNRRADYLAAVWELIDWSKVSEKYTSALSNPSLLAKLKPNEKSKKKPK